MHCRLMLSIFCASCEVFSVFSVAWKFRILIFRLRLSEEQSPLAEGIDVSSCMLRKRTVRKRSGFLTGRCLLFPLFFPQFGETVAADRFVGVLRTEHHLFFVVGQAVRMVRQVAAPYADGVYFGYVLRRSHQRRHRSEGLAREVHVEARHDYPHPAVGQLPADLHQSLVEELRLVDAHDIDVRGHQQDILCRIYRRGADRAGIVRNDLLFGVSHVDAGFEDFDPQALRA